MKGICAHSPPVCSSLGSREESLPGTVQLAAPSSLNKTGGLPENNGIGHSRQAGRDFASPLPLPALKCLPHQICGPFGAETANSRNAGSLGPMHFRVWHQQRVILAWTWWQSHRLYHHSVAPERLWQIPHRTNPELGKSGEPQAEFAEPGQ